MEVYQLSTYDVRLWRQPLDPLVMGLAARQDGLCRDAARIGGQPKLRIGIAVELERDVVDVPSPGVLGQERRQASAVVARPLVEREAVEDALGPQPELPLLESAATM